MNRVRLICAQLIWISQSNTYRQRIVYYDERYTYTQKYSVIGVWKLNWNWLKIKNKKLPMSILSILIFKGKTKKLSIWINKLKNTFSALCFWIVSEIFDIFMLFEKLNSIHTIYPTQHPSRTSRKHDTPEKAIKHQCRWVCVVKWTIRPCSTKTRAILYARWYRMQPPQL